jgi:hypothetical protein
MLLSFTDIGRNKVMTEEIHTDNADALRNIEELYRCGAIDQERYLEIRKAILFKDKKKKRYERNK